MTVAPSLDKVAIEANIKQFLLVLSVSLSVATLPQIFSWFRHIPYTLLLVIFGLGLAFVDVRLVNLSPGLILSIFLPPLLFEAAWNLQWSKLKRDLIPICLFAIVGVLISIAGVAFGLHQLAGLSLTTALLVGASLSATDPVSVTALFRELGVERRLSILIEGESLFNDGVAVVAFGFLVAFALGTGELAVQPILSQFLQVVGIGIGIGGLMGFGISYMTQRFDLPLVEQSLTLVSAYGTYLITEDLGGSGVIGVVTNGLILGSFGSSIGMSPQTRAIVSEFWEFLSFFVNSIVFLLIGDQIRFAILGENLSTIALTIGAMILTRAVSIYGLSFISNRLARSDISAPNQTILCWGGLRGSVSIALALSLPVILPERKEIIATVFGVVLFTLLVQGLTIQPLLKKLKLLGNQPFRHRYAEAIARQTALQRVLQYLENIENRPGMTPEFYCYQMALLQDELTSRQTEIVLLLEEHPELQDLSVSQVQLELQAIEAETYAELVRAGQINQTLPLLISDQWQKVKKKSDEF